MGRSNKKVEVVRTSLVKKIPLSNPLEGHPISEKEEYVKKIYIDFLCIIAQYENEDSENQTEFIQRIMAGAGLTEPISEHIKNAMEITEERCGEFLNQCKENNLIDIFIVDSLLIACADGEPNRKQVEFISEIACALQVKKNRMKWLGGLAKAILEQDAEIYQEVCEIIPHDIKTEVVMNIVPYLKEFVNGVMLDTEDILWIYAKEKTPFDVVKYVGSEYSLQLERKEIILENIIISSQKGIACTKRISFVGNTLSIKNCEFCNIQIYADVYSVFIDNCLFSGLGTMSSEYYEYCIGMRGTRTLTIKNSKIENIQMGKGDRCVFHISEKKFSAFIEQCTFRNVYSANYLIIDSTTMEKEQINIKKCIFEQCSTFDLIWRSKSCLKVDDCKFIKCDDRLEGNLSYWGY